MIELVEMPGERFPAYRENLIREYAKEKVRAGAWSPDEAPRRARADLDGLLPNGTSTRDHFLYEIRDVFTSEKVGTLWFALQDGGAGRSVWIYDIEILAPFRRKGRTRRVISFTSYETGPRRKRSGCSGSPSGIRAPGRAFGSTTSR